ncbi:MAG: YkgJ family cysteine cluster protein [Desulfarculus sp.]|nr:YkgJ family cysteine cluster protein [Desulfarculus sp.]
MTAFQPPTPPAGPPAGVCARCRRCCTLAPGEEGLVFPLSQEDVARLDQAHGHARWREQSPNSSELLDMLAKLFPRSPAGLARAFPPGDSHWRLAVRADGRCFFLGGQGCQLTAEQRPAHCRLFPVWRLGNHILPLRVECLAIAEAKDMRGLMKSLDLDVALVKELFARIQRAWGLEEERDT